MFTNPDAHATQRKEWLSWDVMSPEKHCCQIFCSTFLHVTSVRPNNTMFDFICLSCLTFQLPLVITKQLRPHPRFPQTLLELLTLEFAAHWSFKNKKNETLQSLTYAPKASKSPPCCRCSCPSSLHKCCPHHSFAGWGLADSTWRLNAGPWKAPSFATRKLSGKLHSENHSIDRKMP